MCIQQIKRKREPIRPIGLIGLIPRIMPARRRALVMPLLVAAAAGTITGMAASAPSPAIVKRRLRRMAELLEGRFGAPEWDGPEEPLGAMVRTILSQSTSDANSSAAFESLRRRFPTWRATAEADPRDIAAAIRSGGLSNQKSVRIRDFLRWVNATFGGYTIDSLCDMAPAEAYERFCCVPGIGVKTVAVTMLFACGKDVFPVDTHVTRVTRRVGVVLAAASPERIHRQLEPHVPPGRGLSLHVNLLRLGRTLCRSTPRCEVCPLNRICDTGKGRSRARTAT